MMKNTLIALLTTSFLISPLGAMQQSDTYQQEQEKTREKRGRDKKNLVEIFSHFTRSNIEMSTVSEHYIMNMLGDLGTTNMNLSYILKLLHEIADDPDQIAIRDKVIEFIKGLSSTISPLMKSKGNQERKLPILPSAMPSLTKEEVEKQISNTEESIIALEGYIDGTNLTIVEELRKMKLIFKDTLYTGNFPGGGTIQIGNLNFFLGQKGRTGYATVDPTFEKSVGNLQEIFDILENPGKQYSKRDFDDLKLLKQAINMTPETDTLPRKEGTNGRYAIYMFGFGLRSPLLFTQEQLNILNTSLDIILNLEMALIQSQQQLDASKKRLPKLLQKRAKLDFAKVEQWYENQIQLQITTISNNLDTILTQTAKTGTALDRFLDEKIRHGNLVEIPYFSSAITNNEPRHLIVENLLSILYEPSKYSVEIMMTDWYRRQIDELKKGVDTIVETNKNTIKLSLLKGGIGKVQKYLEKLVTSKKEAEQDLPKISLGDPTTQLDIKSNLTAIISILTEHLKQKNVGEIGLLKLMNLIYYNPTYGNLLTDPVALKQRADLDETFGKLSSTEPFNKNDITNLITLKEALLYQVQPFFPREVLGGKRQEFDPQVRGKLKMAFDKLDGVLDPMRLDQGDFETIQDAISISDLPEIHNILNFNNPLNINLKSKFLELQGLMINSFNKKDYLSMLPLYLERQYKQIRHNEIVKELNLGGNYSYDFLKKLFIELSQMKMTLECFTDLPYHQTLGQDILGKIPVISVFAKDLPTGGLGKIPENVKKIIENINALRFSILQTLNNNKNIDLIKINKITMEKSNNIKNKKEVLKTKKNIWILSLDGGGIRGKIGAEVLKNIQETINLKEFGGNPEKPQTIVDKFDFFAGTSVGGLIALSLNIPSNNPDQAYYDATFVASLLGEEKAKIIFPTLAETDKMTAQLNSFAYSPYGLEELLLNYLHTNRFSDMVKPTLVMTHAKWNQEPLALISYDEKCQNIYAWQAGRATSAASSYFPPMSVMYDNELIQLVDGGFSANNPTLAALDELLKLRENDLPESINILSIGTGTPQLHRNFGYNSISLKGLIDDLSEGAMQAGVRYIEGLVKLKLQELSRKHHVKIHYYRMNPVLGVTIELDDSSEANLNLLMDAFHAVTQNPNPEKKILTEREKLYPEYLTLIDHLNGRIQQDNKDYHETNITPLVEKKDS